MELTPHSLRSPTQYCTTAARVIEQGGWWTRLREAYCPSVSRCPAHISPFICAFLSLRSQPSRFPPDHSGQGLTHTMGLQSASDNSQHKGPESHHSVTSKRRLGVVSRAWGALCRTGAPLIDGWGLCSEDVVEGLSGFIKKDICTCLVTMECKHEKRAQ